VKGIHGIRDPLMELIKDPYDIDWHAYREKREHYVYDSACMACHQKLEQQTLANSKAFLPHRDYFSGKLAGTTTKQCVSCHQHVGHNALGKHLQAMGWELPGSETTAKESSR
jgi:cytochrome c-type protein NapC